MIAHFSIRARVIAGLILAGLAAFLVATRSSQSAAPGKVASAPEVNECRWATGPISIDGRADEPAWQNAQVIDKFVVGWLPGGPRPGRTPTKARLLWDDEYLYFFSDMEDADLYADVKEHDGATWTNDVFELFFKPATEKRGYYEFEISVNNTVMDMFLPSRGSGGYQRWVKDGEFHLKTATVPRGTINRWQDTDQGWSLEGRIPWSDFSPTGGIPSAGQQWPFTLCRYDYSVAFERQELTATAPLTRPDFHNYEDYTLLKFIGAKR